MILIPIVAFIVGIMATMLIGKPVTSESGQYLAVACLAGLDSVFGGIRSALEEKFHSDVFITGFISNVLIAFFLAWLGDKVLFINLYLAVGLVLGSRIFTNLSLIRRFLLTRWQDARERQRLQDLAAQSVQSEAAQ